MKIGCLQFAPVKGDPNANISSVDSILQKADPELDLLVLPELAFSGTGFKSLHDARPLLERSTAGVSTAWAKATALKYDCAVVVGYPEKALLLRGDSEVYNSLVGVSREGHIVAQYRASQLQPGEEYWAQEGRDGFFGDWVPELGQTVLGLSMDINSYKFREPWSKFGFAFHILRVEANIAVLSMCWPTALSAESFSDAPFDPDMDTLTYWVSRLEPVIRADSPDELIVIFSNRCGADDDVTYAGTSTVLGILQGEVTIYGVLGRGESDLLTIDTQKTPLGKLVYRPKTNMCEEREAQKAAFMARAKEDSPPKSPNCYIQITNPDRRRPVTERPQGSRDKVQREKAHGSMEKTQVPPPPPLETLAQTTYTPQKPASRRTPKLSLATTLEGLQPRSKTKPVHVATPINARPRGYSALATLDRPKLQNLVEVETPVDGQSHVPCKSRQRQRGESTRDRNPSPLLQTEYAHQAPSLSPWGHESSRVSGSDAPSEVFDRDASFLSSTATSLDSSQLPPTTRQPSPAHLDAFRGRTSSPRLLSQGKSNNPPRANARSQSAMRQPQANNSTSADVIRETVLTTRPRAQETLTIKNSVIPIAASPSIWTGSATEASFASATVDADRRRDRPAEPDRPRRNSRIEAQKALRLQIGNMRARSASQTRAAARPVRRVDSPPCGVPASAHPNSAGHFEWPLVRRADEEQMEGECGEEVEKRQQMGRGVQGEWWVDQWMSREAEQSVGRRSIDRRDGKKRLGLARYAPVTPKPMKLSFE
ncbi:hypothetical protein TD95_002166 [Thielaviopsis punctulata]|uniref:CN hydrolase domain-containing protein n=1 Tax=Thielaviopsis punctulata TaxID=72032 RepID=A0A0F4Z6K8_9PEZI|nr:hypothetical protein TD95_002166 [Thielaviopsis punctulata]